MPCTDISYRQMVGLPRFWANASRHTPLFMLVPGRRVASDCFWKH